VATVPTPSTQTAGTVVPAATINSQGNLATYLAGRTESGGARKPLCRMRQTVAQSLTSGADTAITFDTEDVDYDNGHSTTTNTSRYTAGTAGWYAAYGIVAFAANATGDRVVQLRINGTTLVPGRAHTLTNTVASAVYANSASWLVFLNAGDYVELIGTQISGGALNTSVASSAVSVLAVEWRSV
jgi:hypothetical protein